MKELQKVIRESATNSGIHFISWYPLFNSGGKKTNSVFSLLPLPHFGCVIKLKFSKGEGVLEGDLLEGGGLFKGTIK